MNSRVQLRGANRGNPPSGETVRRYALLTAAIAAICILSGAALLQFFALRPYDVRSIALHRATAARAYVEVINSRVHLLQAEAARVAATAEVVAAIAQRDPVGIAAEQERLLTNMGYLRGVRLYPLGGAVAEPASKPPVNFSALDMVRTAERGTVVLPEVFRASVGLLVFAVATVRDRGGVVVGTVLLTVDGSYLAEALGAIDAAGGKVELEQKFAGSAAVPIIEFGQGGGGESVRLPTAVAHWFLTYEPSLATVHDNSVSLLSLLPAFAVVVLGVLATIALAFMRLERSLQQDLTRLREALPLDHRKVPPALQLAPLQEFARDLHRAFAPPAGSDGEPDRLPAGGGRRAGAPRPDARAEPPPPPTQDVEIPLEADDDALDVAANPASATANSKPAPAPATAPSTGLDPTIFRAYDIRGIVDRNLGEEVVYKIGKAIGAEAVALSIKRLVVGGDGRLSSPSLREQMIGGLRDCGIDVVDIGEVPTPVLYYATHLFHTGSGVMITGSHNPAEYNGLKMMLAGETLAEGRIQKLRDRIEHGQFVSGKGNVEKIDIIGKYIDRIAEDVTVAQTMKVVVDCGNGVAGKIAPALLRALGCDVVELFCDVDGTFPNHHPDPAVPENLEDLIATVKREKADIGLAFDGDGDRLGVVSNSGQIIWPDRLMMLFARDIVGRNPGTDVIYDVKCSRHLSTIITELGGRPIMWKTGHSHIKAKIKETGALLGGEFSGHICFLERWYGFDDALYSAARLLEIVGATSETVDEIFEQFPNPMSTPEIKVETTESRKFEIVQQLAATGNFDGGSINTIDGIRVDFNDGWGLIRASNTSPVLTLRFESDTAAGLVRVTRLFQRELKKIDPQLVLEV